MKIERNDYESSIELWKVRNSNGVFELGSNYLGKILDELLLQRPNQIELSTAEPPQIHHPDFANLVSELRGPLEQRLNKIGIIIDNSLSLEKWIQLLSKASYQVKKKILIQNIHRHIMSSPLLGENIFKP